MQDFAATTLLVTSLAIVTGAIISHLLGGSKRVAVTHGIGAGLGAVFAFALLPLLYIRAGAVAWSVAFAAFAVVIAAVLWTASRRVRRK